MNHSIRVYGLKLIFSLGIPTCWHLKTLKFALPQTRTQKFALPPMQNPNACQWNIGCVGSPGVGHVHFTLVVSISFALGSQQERSCQWNMGFSD